jgi:ABC-type sugar transport system permease subunit
MAKQMKQETRKALTGWAFISLWVIGFAVFTAYPIVYSIVLSFSDYVPAKQEFTFVGFKNFANALVGLDKALVLQPITEFLMDAVFQVFIINVFAVLFAVLLNTSIKGRGLY